MLEECRLLSEKKGAGSFKVSHDALEAAKDADVVYTDSWMSYHISGDEAKSRIEALRLNFFLSFISFHFNFLSFFDTQFVPWIHRPFQVTKEVMKVAKKDAIFMNCLPAARVCSFLFLSLAALSRSPLPSLGI